MLPFPGIEFPCLTDEIKPTALASCNTLPKVDLVDLMFERRGVSSAWKGDLGGGPNEELVGKQPVLGGLDAARAKRNFFGFGAGKFCSEMVSDDPKRELKALSQLVHKYPLPESNNFVA